MVYRDNKERAGCLREILADIKRETGLNQAGIARKLGLKPQAITGWFKTGTIAEETRKELCNICEPCRHNPDWVIRSDVPKFVPPPEPITLIDKEGRAFMRLWPYLNRKFKDKAWTVVHEHLAELSEAFRMAALHDPDDRARFDKYIERRMRREQKQKRDTRLKKDLPPKRVA